MKTIGLVLLCSTNVDKCSLISKYKNCVHNPQAAIYMITLIKNSRVESLWVFDPNGYINHNKEINCSHPILCQGVFWCPGDLIWCFQWIARTHLSWSKTDTSFSAGIHNLTRESVFEILVAGYGATLHLIKQFALDSHSPGCQCSDMFNVSQIISIFYIFAEYFNKRGMLQFNLTDIYTHTDGPFAFICAQIFALCTCNWP